MNGLQRSSLDMTNSSFDLNITHLYYEIVAAEKDVTSLLVIYKQIFQNKVFTGSKCNSVKSIQKKPDLTYNKVVRYE